MPGTKAGGQKAAERNMQRDTEYLEKYGMTFYQYIGSKGGSKSGNKGFASDRVGRDGLTGKERAIIVGSKGGRKTGKKGMGAVDPERRREIYAKRGKNAV